MNNEVAAQTLPRYVVGIDLGTTNSALAWIDTLTSERAAHPFPVPQFVAAGQWEARETLPSFHYQPLSSAGASHSYQLPWEHTSATAIVGVFAREQSKLSPGQGAESAKSWLCHPGVDRTAPMLPWQGSKDVQLFSPVEISAAYLRHLRSAWDAAHPEHLLATQDVILTLPASFDEIARELTIQAARMAGLPKVVLLEEPQAAFYAWIHQHVDTWDQRVQPGQRILICDVGGGTTDFTLIRVRKQADGAIQFHRTAVGDHLILGGDNFDLALAQNVEQKLLGEHRLEPRQWHSLVRLCRHAKETLLSRDAPETYSLSIPGAGSRLIAGALQLELRRDDIRQQLLAGFFPAVGLQECPQAKRSGFQEFGLPYAADPAITRQLAHFLWCHRESEADAAASEDDVQSARPDIVLFNGGVFLSPLLQERVIEQLSDWFDVQPQKNNSSWRPQVLENPRYDLAVALGAAYFGLVRRGEGVRIAAGLARSYYFGVETNASGGPVSTSAICIMPGGAEPGDVVDLQSPAFDLTVAAPVEFQLFYSGIRLTDRPGDILPVDPTQLTALPPIRTVLKQRKAGTATTIPVHIRASLNEIGLLQLSCVHNEGPGQWQLQFDVRAATHTEQQGHSGTGELAGVLEAGSLEQCRRLLEAVFALGTEPPASLPKRLSAALSLSRDQWPPTLLRDMWSWLLEWEPGRQRSADHEARWLNLLGFALRPGFGVALDDWRVAETWRSLRGRLLHPRQQCLAEWWTLWRRLAGGLTAGQQQALATPLLTGLKDQVRKLLVTKEPRRVHSAGGTGSQEVAESWRMLASLELIPVAMKIDLGRLALSTVMHDPSATSTPVLLWSIGRLGARQPFYGPLNCVVPVEEVLPWIDQLLSMGNSLAEPHSHTAFALVQLARRTQDRFRDLPESRRAQVIRWLERHHKAESLIQLVRDGGTLANSEQAQIFGESLPLGLRLRDA